MTDKQNQVETYEEPAINLLELVQVVVKRKMFIIKVCSGAIVAAVIYSLTLPNIYSATAKVVPPQKESGGGIAALLSQAGGLAGLAAGGVGGGSDLYVGILKSRSVADAVISRLGLLQVYQASTMDQARQRLESAVKVQAGKDSIISIVSEDRDPARAALLSNTFVDELGKSTIRLNLTKAGTERSFLEKRLDVVKKDLKAAEDDLKNYSQHNKIVEVESQAKAAIEGVARLRAELAKQEVHLAVVRSNQTEQSPEVLAIQTGIRQLKGELSTLGGTGSGGEGIPSVGTVPGLGLEYSRKLREFKTQEAIFEQLTKQFELAKLNEAKDSSALQVLDEAVVPLMKERPARSVIVILAAASAFVVSVLLILVQEHFANMPEADKKIVEDIRRQALAFRQPKG